jgi:hypothetical protein
MDSMNTLEFVYQFRKSFRLTIPRKHGIINQGQRLCAELKKLSDLSNTILESDNLSGAILASTKINTVFFGKLEKDFNP